MERSDGIEAGATTEDLAEIHNEGCTGAPTLGHAWLCSGWFRAWRA